MYRVEITEVATGKSGIKEFDSEYHEFLWMEGNFSCDCNRRLFFCETQGIDEEIECSDGKYTIKIMQGTVAVQDISP